LAGYVIKTGSNFHDYYVLPAIIVGPGEYWTAYASDSHLSLPNSGGAAELLDPAGNVVNQTAVYDAAPEGQSWALVDGDWSWTLQTTPGRPNVLVRPVLPAALDSAFAGVTSKTTKASTAAGAKSTAAKTAAPKTAKVATTKVAAAKKVAAKTIDPIVAATDSKPGRWLLVGAVLLTIGYAVYEFRFDIKNYYYLLKRKFAVDKTKA
jgi:hypothetical protein